MVVVKVGGGCGRLELAAGLTLCLSSSMSPYCDLASSREMSAISDVTSLSCCTHSSLPVQGFTTPENIPLPRGGGNKGRIQEYFEVEIMLRRIGTVATLCKACNRCRVSGVAMKAAGVQLLGGVQAPGQVNWAPLDTLYSFLDLLLISRYLWYAV